MMRVLIGAAIFLTLLSYPLGCAFHRSPTHQLDPEVALRWGEHDAILTAWLGGKGYTADLERAVRFFEEPTGIRSRGAYPSWAGYITNEFFPEDVKHWRAWYRKRAHCLQIDAGTGDIIYATSLHPDCRR